MLLDCWLWNFNRNYIKMLQTMESQMKLTIASEGFERHTVNAFNRLHCDVDSSDVTLVADDMTKMPAHKMILSISSPFFASLLENSQPGHVVLFLGGFSKHLLQSLLSFVYVGRVEVEEQDMKQFSKMLKDLKILDQHLKDGDEGKLEPDLPSPDQLKVEHESDTDSDDDFNNVFEREDDSDVKEATKHVKPDIEKEALLAQVLAKSPIKHSQEFLDKKVARLQALTCSHCHFRAKSFERLESHIRRFHETEWPCEQCGKVLMTEGRLKKHILTKHESLRSKGMCDVQGCDFVTPFPGKLKVHQRKEHGGEKFYCDQCDFSNWVKHTVEKHKAAKHEGKLHHCDQCSAAYPFEQGLRRHKAIVHDGKRISCPHCDYKATTNSNLRIHVAAKHEMKRFHCDLCDWSGSQPGAVNIHKRQKHDAVDVLQE